jgi:putative hydrolase of the HAD superfamily
MHKTVTTLTFDLDNTLWEVMPVIRAAERAVNAWLDAHYPMIGKRYTVDDVGDLRREVMLANEHRIHDLTFLRKEVLRRMATGAGYDARVADEAFEVFDEHRNRVTLYDDVPAALEELARHFRLLAVTNGNASLRRTGIAAFFAGKVSAASAGAAKPDPKIFRAALAEAGAAASRTLHVGDDPALDVEGARQMGFRTAWVNRIDADWPQALPPPDIAVTNLTELIDAIRSAPDWDDG